MDEPHVVDAVPPEEAFAILSDPTRVSVLRALWDIDGHEATFSELREAVGMRDSGQFNYHLGKFEGHFVEETDDGYGLTLAGVHLVGSLFAGAYTKTGSVDRVAVDEPCPGCGGTMWFSYDDGQARVDCDDCVHASQFPVPPGVFERRETGELPSVAARYARDFVRRARDGFCPICDGRVHPSVASLGDGADTPADVEPPDWLADVPLAQFDCERCGETVRADLGTTLLDHPAVVSFFYERGVDVRETSVWRFTTIDPDRARLLDDDSGRASVAFDERGTRLTLTVDGELNVVDVERD